MKNRLIVIAWILAGALIVGGIVRFKYWKFHEKFPQASVWVFILGG